VSGQEPLPPLQIPFTPEGMAMVSAILSGMSGAMDKQAERMDDLEDRMGFRP